MSTADVQSSEVSAFASVTNVDLKSAVVFRRAGVPPGQPHQLHGFHRGLMGHPRSA
jgi:hypothetical protein